MMRIARDPRVEFAALAALRELLSKAASAHPQLLSPNTPFRTWQETLATRSRECLCDANASHRVAFGFCPGGVLALTS